MAANSLFVVIEGLDGSGKTTVGRQLSHFLNKHLNNAVKLTFEPHDASSGGLFIRQILQKKNPDFSPATLALAFAGNRLDHCDRVINRWLSTENRMLICDRYYLSSLVYQQAENISMAKIMEINAFARKPDLIFFLDVSNDVCFSRMQKRNKPQELFERDLDETRDKYQKAIKFLRQERSELIYELNADGSIKDVAEEILGILKTKYSFNTELPDFELQQFTITAESTARFLDYIKSLGYVVADQLDWDDAHAFELTVSLPGEVPQRGIALLIPEPQQYEDILDAIGKLSSLTDFMFVCIAGDTSLVTAYYERAVIQFNDAAALSPSIRFVTEAELSAFAASVN